MWARSGADDQREAPGPRLDPPAGVEADQGDRDGAEEEAQAAADRLVEVAVQHEPRAPGPAVHVDQEAALVGRVAEGVLPDGAAGRRHVPEPDRLDVVEAERPEIERADREQREVVLDVALQLAVAAELLVEVTAQVGAARGVLHPERQILAERRGRVRDQVVALEDPDAVLDAAADAPEGEIAAEVGLRVIEAAA